MRFYLQSGSGSRGDSALNSASVNGGIIEGKNLTLWMTTVWT